MTAEQTSGADRLATGGTITGALAVAISIIFPLGPVAGLVAILLSVRALRSGARARREAALGIAFGCISFLIVAGWGANGFK